jgi:uncharacterized surface protein with fasciclin (FAS1) repeats
MRKLTALLIAGAMAVALAAPAMARASAGAKPGTETIVQLVLANDGEFDVLQAAVIEAGLVDALNGRTQYTVFAPTDRAFVKTFRGVLGNQSLTEADVIAFIDGGGVDEAFGAGALANILLYHVTEGRRIGTSVLAAPRYTMLNGDTLTRGELVAAGVVAANLSASNGVIHTLTKGVLLP